MTVIIRIAALLFAASLAGCQGGFVAVAPEPPPTYQKLGHAEGQACGTLFLLATAYNFIPVLLNERVDRAYAKAVSSVPGATALVDVEMREDWYWWVLGSTRCTTIEGEAIK